ncbi:hypothetical protein DAPPUDRAFT_316801 [Daphnia pulex]|uniref:Uncharacterized protein n=1 Tax=Daphnia pulex TaxID=6669 RepID=E9GE18_DAPPU|nr:hypothetical protein DAPPUDRAFT_316801 [Daphnia pulex]|eukprot:EFX82392.1 hypothetical protein DAPPUDRAFT_316801 [Daphnia pulex]
MVRPLVTWRKRFLPDLLTVKSMMSLADDQHRCREVKKRPLSAAGRTVFKDKLTLSTDKPTGSRGIPTGLNESQELKFTLTETEIIMTSEFFLQDSVSISSPSESLKQFEM